MFYFKPVMWFRIAEWAFGLCPEYHRRKRAHSDSTIDFVFAVGVGGANNQTKEITWDLQIMSLLPSMLNFANSARVTN